MPTPPKDDGGVTPPSGGSVEVGSGGGKPGATVTPPSGGSDDDNRKVRTIKVEVPKGSTVEPGGSDDVKIKTPEAGQQHLKFGIFNTRKRHKTQNFL